MMDRRITVFLSATLVLITLIALVRPLPRVSEAIERWFWVNKVFGTGQHQVVVFGDSRIYRGFATPVADSVLKVPTLNYGFSSACATTDMLNHVDGRVKDGGILILGITPFLLFERDKISNRHFKMIRALEYHAILRRKYIDSRIWRIMDRISLVDLFMHITDTRAGVYERMYASGYCATSCYPPDSARANASYIKRFSEQPDAVDHLPDLIAHIAKWRKRGVSVFAVQPPISSGLAAIEDTLGRYDVASVRVALEAAGVKWVNLPRTGYITYDGSHLDERSATVWTRQICDTIMASRPFIEKIR
jgi:hypothetical protein